MKIGNYLLGRTGLRLSFGLLAAAALTLISAATSKATLVFDNITNVSNANLTSTSSTPNTFMGDGYNLAAGTVDVTGFDVFPVNQSGTTFNAIQLNIYVWGTVNTGTVSTTAPAFSNLLATYSLTSAGTFTTGTFERFESTMPGVTPAIQLGAPLVLTNGTTIGVTFNYQGSTDGGLTFTSFNSLTSLISYGTPATTGSNVFNGYYRNANSETNGNFTSTLRALGVTNQSLALRVYGDVVAVPEPGTWALLVAAGSILLVWRKRSAKVVAV